VGIKMRIVVVTMAAAFMMLLAAAVGAAQNETVGINVSDEDIIEVATADGDFDTLVSAIREAGLTDTLSGAGPFTVFAPTDEAFDKIPQEVLENLTTNETQRDNLRTIITYHVVPGLIMFSDLENGTTFQTMQADDLNITTDNGAVMVDDARIVRPDIMASNGVIHAIDTVLIPPTIAANTDLEDRLRAGESRVEEDVAVAERDVATEEAAEEERAEEAAAREENRTPGFEATFALIGLLAVFFVALRRNN